MSRLKDRYVNPLTDFGFKKLFGSEPNKILLIDFLNQILPAKHQINDQVLFYYCDAEGNVNDSTNPNGSVNNIAGITNKSRNVFGMMPHPERAASEKLFNVSGRVMFESILASV